MCRYSGHYPPLTPKYRNYVTESLSDCRDQGSSQGFRTGFRDPEKAEKAMNERDERTGERLYPECHVIERTIE